MIFNIEFTDKRKKSVGELIESIQNPPKLRKWKEKKEKEKDSINTLALCQHGIPGIITSYKKGIYYGYKLSDGSHWQSKNPNIIGEIYDEESVEKLIKYLNK